MEHLLSFCDMVTFEVAESPLHGGNGIEVCGENEIT